MLNSRYVQPLCRPEQGELGRIVGLPDKFVLG